MAMPSQITSLPKDANFFPVQGVLGTLGNNADAAAAPSPIEATTVQIAIAINTVTVLTDTGTKSFLLNVGDVYELALVLPVTASNNDTMCFGVAFGDGTDPAAGDFAALPAAAGLANSTRGLIWNPWRNPDPWRFKAEPGQRRIALKNLVALVAIPTVQLRRMC